MMSGQAGEEDVAKLGRKERVTSFGKFGKMFEPHGDMGTNGTWFLRRLMYFHRVRLCG